MKRLDHHRIRKNVPTLLAVLSTLLLSAFLLFWNINQYKRAKSALKKEISLHLESAYNNVQQDYVNSLMKDLGFRFNSKIVKKNDTKSGKISYKYKASYKSSDTSIYESSEFYDSISKENLSFPFNKIGLDTLIKNGTVNILNMMLDRTIENATSDFDSISRQINRSDTLSRNQVLYMYTNNDTSITKGQKEDWREKVLENFQKKLNDNNLIIDFVIEKDSLINSKNSFIKIPSKFYNLSQENIYVKKYSFFLFQKILPSILFSILLLIVVVTAFIVLLNSWYKQRKLVEIKNTFISNMTHELKTPISTVSVALEALQEYGILEDKTKTNEYINISRKEVDRLSLLVDKVLKTILLESEKNPIKLVPVDLVHLINEALSTMQMRFEKKEVSLSKQLPDDPIIVMGDKIHLTNVLYNLLENAIKYNKAPIRIAVKLESKNNEVVFKVEDNGIGVAPEHQKRIFGKFYRVPNQDHHNVKGHGVGLSYVKQVIEELKGTITLQSELKKGSIFIIHLKKHES